jgi:hypothetical protein
MSNDDWGPDPFEGMNVFRDLPPAPTDKFIHEVESIPNVRPTNISLLRGLKKQTVEEFVKYLKATFPGEINATDLSLTLGPIEASDLDKAAITFLQSY